MNEPLELKRKDLQTQIMELRTQIVLLDQRLAALEASSAARQQAFTPGWVNDEEPFMTGVDAPPPDIYFIYPSIESDNKVAVIAQEELIRLVFHYDKAKLEKLIGAALAVLKRMEATPDAKSG